MRINGVAPSMFEYNINSQINRQNNANALQPGVNNLSQSEAHNSIRSEDIQCETCETRTYQDRSNDSGVSMQMPTRLSPTEAASAVIAHEREHQVREAAKAEAEGRDVVSNEIRIFTSRCPECGRKYVSGGETRTVTVGGETNPANRRALDPPPILDVLV